MNVRRRRLALASLAAGALALTACAPAVDAAWTPPVWEEASVRVVAQPPAIDLAIASDVAATLTPLRVRHDEVRLQARVAFLPGTGDLVAGFNSEVEAIIRDVIGRQSSETGMSYAPSAGEPGAGLGDRACRADSTLEDAEAVLADAQLGPPGAAGSAVVCDIVVAAGPFLAQRVRVVAGSAGDVSADDTVILYADTASGEFVVADALWRDDAAAQLSADVVEALRRDAGALSLRGPSAGAEDQVSAVDAALASTVFHDGAPVFTIPPGFVAADLVALGIPETTEPMSVAVPAEIAEPLLSPFGQRVLAASREEYQGPRAVPAGEEWLDCGLVPCVGLTYDDGPSLVTPALLDVLRDQRAGGTFYMLGRYAAAAPDTVRRAAAEGHDIGNHTWDHPSLPDLDDDEIRSQLDRTRSVLRDLSQQPVDTFRPPYGEFTADVLSAAGQAAILWSVDTRDWAGTEDARLIRIAVEGAAPGGIILFHDTHERSVRVAPAVIDGLRDRGFALATLTQLFDGRLPTSGAWRAAP